MAAVQTLILLVSVWFASGQRPSYAGLRPIGFPELLNKTTTTPSGLEDKFGEVTTQRLPIEAGGDRELVESLSKLPIDKQPFWLINWQALQANREKPQTYPLKPSPFLESNFQNPNIAPINNPNTNFGFGNPNAGFTNPNTGFVSNQGFVNPNPGFVNTNTGFGNPNPGFVNTNTGFGNPNPDFVNTNTGFGNPNTGFVNTNTGFRNPNPGFVNTNTGFVNPNSGFVNTNTGFVNPNPVLGNANSGFVSLNTGFGNNNPGVSNVRNDPALVGANPSFGNVNTGNTGTAKNPVQSPNLKGQEPPNTNGNSSVENRYGTEATPKVDTITGTAFNKTPASIKDNKEAVTSIDVNKKDEQGLIFPHEEDEFEDIEVKKFYKNH